MKKVLRAWSRFANSLAGSQVLGRNNSMDVLVILSLIAVFLLFSVSFFVYAQPNQFNRNTVASIPDVVFVPLDLMTTKKCSQFILKVHLSMMVLLVGYVLLHSIKIRRAD